MGRVNDPYMDDPYFRDALIINSHGRYTDRPKLDRPSQGKTWKWSVLTLVGSFSQSEAPRYRITGARSFLVVPIPSILLKRTARR